jgi:hypothetical protein
MSHCPAKVQTLLGGEELTVCLNKYVTLLSPTQARRSRSGISWCLLNLDSFILVLECSISIFSCFSNPYDHSISSPLVART